MNSERELEEQLPLLVNGGIAMAEREQLTAAVDQNLDLKRELEFLSALRQGLKDSSEGDHSPGELGLARLKKDIQREKKQVLRVNPVWKRLAVAACAVFVLQTGFWITTELSPTDSDITVLSGNESNAAVVQVLFEGSATADQIQEAVLEVNGSIVAGPSALGLYSIVLQEDTDPQDALTQLRRFEFVESVNLQ